MSSIVLTLSLMALMLVVGLFACPLPREEFHMRALKNDHVIRGSVVFKNVTKIENGSHGAVKVIYSIKVDESYKGDIEQGSTVDVSTTSSERLCGLRLEANPEESLILGFNQSKSGYSISKASLLRDVDQVTDAEDRLLAEYKLQKEHPLMSR